MIHKSTCSWRNILVGHIYIELWETKGYKVNFYTTDDHCRLICTVFAPSPQRNLGLKKCCIQSASLLYTRVFVSQAAASYARHRCLCHRRLVHTVFVAERVAASYTLCP